MKNYDRVLLLREAVEGKEEEYKEIVEELRN